MGSAMQQTTPFQLHKLTNGGPDVCATNGIAFLVSLHSKGSGGSLLDEFPCVCGLPRKLKDFQLQLIFSNNSKWSTFICSKIKISKTVQLANRIGSNIVEVC